MCSLGWVFVYVYVQLASLPSLRVCAHPVAPALAFLDPVLYADTCAAGCPVASTLPPPPSMLTMACYRDHFQPPPHARLHITCEHISCVCCVCLLVQVMIGLMQIGQVRAPTGTSVSSHACGSPCPSPPPPLSPWMCVFEHCMSVFEHWMCVLEHCMWVYG